MSDRHQLQVLRDLRDRGVLTPEDYDAAVARLSVDSDDVQQPDEDPDPSASAGAGAKTRGVGVPEPSIDTVSQANGRTIGTFLSGRRWVLGVAALCVVAALCIALGVFRFFVAKSPQGSPSYKDGVAAAVQYVDDLAAQAPITNYPLGVSNASQLRNDCGYSASGQDASMIMPAEDNSADWIDGCTHGFIVEIEKVKHPGS